MLCAMYRLSLKWNRFDAWINDAEAWCPSALAAVAPGDNTDGAFDNMDLQEAMKLYYGVLGLQGIPLCMGPGACLSRHGCCACHGLVHPAPRPCELPTAGRLFPFSEFMKWLAYGNGTLGVGETGCMPEHADGGRS